MKKLTVALVMALGLLQAPAYSEEPGIPRALAKVDPEKLTTYENVIVPWLQEEFSSGKIIYPDGVMVKRQLIKWNLLRFEKIEGQDRYNIHIEYAVTIKDTSGVEQKGLKGQEIVFWLENEKVMDYSPLMEYWLRARLDRYSKPLI